MVHHQNGSYNQCKRAILHLLPGLATYCLFVFGTGEECIVIVLGTVCICALVLVIGFGTGEESIVIVLDTV